MNFSLISVAIFFIAALVIIIEIVRAINRGLKKTLLTLASVFLAIFASIIIANFLSDLLAPPLMSVVHSMLDVSSIADKITSIDKILLAYVDSLIAPFVFLICFVILRSIIAIIVSIIIRATEKKRIKTEYENENAREYEKNPKVLSAVIGAICGFLVMVVFVSPFMGSLKIATGTVRKVNNGEGPINIRIKSEFVDIFELGSEDVVGNVIYYCGGNLLYKSVATSKLNDNYFSLENEINETFNTAGDMLNMNNVLSNLAGASEEQKNSLRNMGENINKAETLKSAASDVLIDLSKKWLDNEPYEGLEKPQVSKACSTFFNKMLHVCSQTTPDNVGDDLSSLLNVYLIAYEHDILASENYKDMLERANATGAFELIRRELEKNPRMAGITLELETVTIKSIATAIQSFNLENYEGLMYNITSTLNNAMTLDEAQREEYIANMARMYIHNYGINVGDDVIQEVSERLIDDVISNNKQITIDDVKSFWDKYSLSANSSGANTPNASVPTGPSIPNQQLPGEESESSDIVIEEESTEGDATDEWGNPIEGEATDEWGNPIEGEATDEWGDPIEGEATDEWGDPIEGGAIDEWGNSNWEETTDDSWNGSEW